MVNIIFDKVPLGSFVYKTFNLIKERNEITWKIIFDFLERKTSIPGEYFKLRWGSKLFTLESKLFVYHDFTNYQGKHDNYLIFGVDYNFDKIKKKREEKKFKMGILEASIRSLKGSGQTTTGLVMELAKLRAAFP